MEPVKRKRGRPRKHPLPESEGGAVLVSIGIEKKAGAEKGLYSAFIMRTQGDRVLSKQNKQADIKVSALEMMYIEMLSIFVEGNP